MTNLNVLAIYIYSVKILHFNDKNNFKIYYYILVEKLKERLNEGKILIFIFKKSQYK